VVTGVEVAVDEVKDDRLEIPVFPLGAPLVFDKEPHEITEQHAVENRVIRMARKINSRHMRIPRSKKHVRTSPENLRVRLNFL
jgi:hypothetical protein